MSDPRAALDAIGQLPDSEIDIAAAALQLARIDAPEADWQAAEAHLSELARGVMELGGALDGNDVATRAGVLAGLLIGRHRYAGDTETYEDPANANLIQVIERRRGLPVALGILWLHCARVMGWPAHGLDFPGHFLVGLETEPQSERRLGPRRAIVLDVFAGGIPLDDKDLTRLLKRMHGPEAELRPGVLAPMPARRVLLRLQENIRARRLAMGNEEGALACTLDMLRLAPDMASLWREAAGLHERLDHIQAAIRCWARVLELVPDGESAVRSRSAIEELRNRLS